MRWRPLWSLIGLAVRNWRAAQLILHVRRTRLTFLDVPALLDLYVTAANVERLGIPGLFVEAGCALGGSALVIAAAKAPSRPLHIFDTFEMIPPPSEKDDVDAHRRYQEIVQGHARGPGNTEYYGYKPNLLSEVQERFVRFGLKPTEHNITFVKGLFQDTMHFHQPIAFAHIDGDWYESVMTCLERIVPWIQPNGVLIIDDYDHWSGCRRAVDEFFKGRTDFVFQRKSRLHIRRVR